MAVTSDPHISTDAPAIVPPQTHCYHCQYDLQGLDPSSNCPECGRAIEQTLTFGLEHADPSWVRRQARTMLLLIAVPLIQVAEWGAWAHWEVEWAYWGPSWTVTAIAVWACWRLSVPEPGRDPGDAQSAIARGLRLCILAYTVVALVMPFRQHLGQYWLVMVYAGLAALLVANWLFVRLVWLLARRCGRSSAASHARLVMWGLPIAGAVKYAWPVLPFPTPPLVYYVVYAAAWWATLVLALLCVALLGRMHEVLRLVADGRWESHPSRAPVDASQ